VGAIVLGQIPTLRDLAGISLAKAYTRSIDELEWIIDQLLPYAQTNTFTNQATPTPIN